VGDSVRSMGKQLVRLLHSLAGTWLRIPSRLEKVEHVDMNERGSRRKERKAFSILIWFWFRLPAMILGLS
jgi:hypothetical protein